MSSKADQLDVSQIAGNASADVKRLLKKSSNLLSTGFATNFARLEITEISIQPKAEEPGKMEARVVLETTVESDMLNGAGTMHGACAALLIDNSSTLPLMALNYATSERPTPGVSQALNIVYHSPATVGDKIRIVNTSMAVGGRAMSARSEIWSVTHHRLVASGVHIKMQPSPIKSNL